MKKNMLTLILLAVITSFFLSACGKMSTPSIVEDSGYPHSYPRN